MQSIIIETEQTISLKRKQIHEHQNFINEMAFEMSNRVKSIYELKNQIEILDRDLHQLKKNNLESFEDTFKKRNSNETNSLGSGPVCSGHEKKNINGGL